ncbi:MAG: hypothetical protein MZV64_35105 [Ignavibacteriales bacterium]|nr:hypothetical protein [Ignavibacteriales bacterium]
MVTPERLGLCGAYNWLDCKASFSINPTGPNQPIKLGKQIDDRKGYWAGTNDYAKVGSHGVVNEVSMYSIMENPMTACGCFECIVMLIPEANGVMVVSREDTSMTPAGMTFSTLAGIAGGGHADPGRDGRRQVLPHQPQVHLRRRRLQARGVDVVRVEADRWPTSSKPSANAKATPTCMDKIADASNATTVEELLAWLEAHNHPTMTMEPMF